MTERIQVLVADDVDYEEIFAEIQVDGDCVAVISQEADELRIEFDQSWIWAEPKKDIALSEFKAAIARAEASLAEMKSGS